MENILDLKQENLVKKDCYNAFLLYLKSSFPAILFLQK